MLGYPLHQDSDLLTDHLSTAVLPEFLMVDTDLREEDILKENKINNTMKTKEHRPLSSYYDRPLTSFHIPSLN
jgi:hypothetical protein